MKSLKKKTHQVERRSGIDRRGQKATLLHKYLLIGRRGVSRRKEDYRTFQMLDRYSSRVCSVILVIIGLSLLDALFTLMLIERGAQELNPIMAYCLEKSPTYFVGVKYFLTCLSALTVLLIKDAYLFRTRTKARVLFFLIMVPFVIVIPWQLLLIFDSF